MVCRNLVHPLTRPIDDTHMAAANVWQMVGVCLMFMRNTS
jgi:hypothetical protein